MFLYRYKNKYFALNGYYPTDENISKELKISLKTVKLINQTVNTIFLDKSVSLNNSKQEKFKDDTHDSLSSSAVSFPIMPFDSGMNISEHTSNNSKNPYSMPPG